MSEATVVHTIHSPDGETFVREPVDFEVRALELEVELEKARAEAAHYKTVARLLCDKFAAGP